MTIRNKTETELLAKIITENHDSLSYHGTLSLDEEHAASSVAAVRCLRAKFKSKLQKVNPFAKLILVSGYGGITGRIHCHFIIRGVAPDLIRKAWEWGDVVSCSQLHRPEGNEDNVFEKAIAAYYCKHQIKEPNGLTFFATVNHTVNGTPYGKF